ncbi:MAG: sigma-70 family RNA polymerase sigma factor [Candidatus Aceula meridiana]|nr:sigma-70 family RNA polymerase sigma factor [Candidatus Aceula meridiana]
MKPVALETITKAAQGDLYAFEEIYRTFCNFVYSISWRMSGNNEDAEEITQDVFLKVHKSLKNFERRSSLKTWIYRITINTTINYQKRKHLKTPVSLDEVGIEKFASPLPSSPDEEIQDRVNKLLSVLNDDQKICMILRNIEGLSYEEIAQSLKININTVRTRLKRAREKLLSLRKEVVPYEV